MDWTSVIFTATIFAAVCPGGEGGMAKKHYYKNRPINHRSVIESTTTPKIDTSQTNVQQGSLGEVKGENPTLEELPLEFLSPTVNRTAAEKKEMTSEEKKSWADKLAPKIDSIPDENAGVTQSAKAGFLNPLRPYIVGGEEASVRQFPWQAGIVVDKKSFCGGSLISLSHILTAAHCADNFDTFVIYLGGSKLPPAQETGRVIVTTKNKVVHDKWDPYDMQNDIAILIFPTLTKDQMKNPNIMIIRLPASNMANLTFEGQASVITGWGLNSTGGALTKTLNSLNLTVVPLLRCIEAYGDFLQSSVLCCDTFSTSKATCQGDSGGPLVFIEADKKYTQIGVVSFGPTVCGQGPLGFTRVTSYLGWISNVAGISARKVQA